MLKFLLLKMLEILPINTTISAMHWCSTETTYNLSHDFVFLFLLADFEVFVSS
jgi:hypothetical protein